jgi:hypothetical protein
MQFAHTVGRAEFTVSVQKYGFGIFTVLNANISEDTTRPHLQNRNLCVHLQDYTVSQPRRPQSEGYMDSTFTKTSPK